MRRDYIVGLTGAGSGPDPDQVLHLLYGCGGELNYTGYCSAEIDKLIEQQSLEADPEKRSWSGRSSGNWRKTAPDRSSFTTAARPAGIPTLKG
jgi:ABC-type transport system substrate-binding protein